RAAREALRLGNDEPAEDLARAADARPGCRPLATLAGVALLARGDRAAARARLAAGEPADAALAALVAETDALVEWLVASEVTLPLDIPAAPQGLGAALEQVARSPHASRIALVLSPLCALALDRVEVLHGVVDSPYGRSGWRTLGPLARERRLPAVLRGGLTLLAEVNDPRLRVGIGQEVGADQPLLAATLLATGASGESDERIRSLAQALELARAASEADAQPRWRARLIVAAAVDLARLQRKALSEVVLEADDARLRGATDLLVEAFLAGQDLPPDDGARARAAEALLEHVGSGHAPLAPVVDRLAALPGATPERTLVLASVRFASGGDDDPERLLADALARASAAESQVRAAAATAFTLRQFNAAVTRGAVATADLSRAMRLALTALDLATTPEARAPLAMTLGQAADLGLQGAPRLDLDEVALPPATTAEQAYARAVVLAAQGRVAQADEALAAARRTGRRPGNLDLLVERVVARARGLTER
ncbi:MAG: hypothetical protein KF878_02550, partial [Planctomycetes bacterium]|nr:hypothetical protein [Planctomycetota bacterium]